MAPEYGATIGYFPIDDETLAISELTGRDPHLIKLVETYAKEQGMFRTDASPDPMFTDTWSLISAPWCRACRAPAGRRTGCR